MISPVIERVFDYRLIAMPAFVKRKVCDGWLEKEASSYFFCFN